MITSADLRLRGGEGADVPELDGSVAPPTCDSLTVGAKGKAFFEAVFVVVASERLAAEAIVKVRHLLRRSPY